jgi:hypothetical protein
LSGLFLRIFKESINILLQQVEIIIVLFLSLYRNNRSGGEWHIELQTLPVTAGSDFFDKQSAIMTHFHMYKAVNRTA